MDRASAMASIAEVFEDVMDIDPDTVTEAATGNDIEEWDSLSHVRLMIAIERRFGLRFSNAEIEAIGKVGDIADLVMAKQAG